MPKLSFNTKRVICGIVLVVVFPCALNDKLEWHWFGAFDSLVGTAAFVIVICTAVFIVIPAEVEVRSHSFRRLLRERRRLKKDESD